MEELIPFLDPNSDRLDLKVVALQHLLGLTGTKDGIAMIGKSDTLLRNLVLLTKDASDSVVKDAALALINLSSDVATVKSLLELPDLSVVAHLWTNCIENKDCHIADPACMIVSNFTIHSSNCVLVWNALKSADISIDRIVSVFCLEGYNSKGAKLHYLGPALSNLSQLAEVRQQMLDSKSSSVLQRLLTFTEFKASKVRRGGIIGAVRNCCFETRSHEWMLDDQVDVLPRLLLPLAGPTPSDLSPEDIEKLPLDLQYLDDAKTVEEDPDLRQMLLEALLQLCATRKCREKVRNAGAYLILKELHKHEKDNRVRLACENLVDVLIKTEEEISVDNLHTVEIPKDIVPTLEAMDKDYLKE